MSAYNIAVLGPIPKDHITTHHGEVIEKYGCAMHPTVALSKLLEGEGTVIPVSHVRKVDEQPIKKILEKHANIRLDHITSFRNQGAVINLEFKDQNNRIEKQTGFMNPIVPEDIKDLLHCDVFVCVPITDYEVPLQTLSYIKDNSDATIIFDAHGPTNTVTTSGDRHLKFWLDRDIWLPYIDVLKMNLEESHCCWYEKEYEEMGFGHFDNRSTDHLPGFAEYVLERGVKALIVTLDEQGGALFYKKDGKIVADRTKAIRVNHVVDTTGCGDSFAGGLGFGLLEDSSDYHGAIKYANALGAQRTQGKTFDVFKSKKDTDQMIKDHYGEI
ncbi:MAG: carbohydrate kinase family protein [Flavobacteriales bacterium]|nr:carbohydrate kinase family protein [Flavobacteriales bacterium]